MAQDENRTQAKSGGGYVWDPEKLAWVEVKETLSEEAVAEPVKAEHVEEAAVDETVVESAALAAPLEMEGIEYKGVLIRLGAAVIDWIIISIIGLIIRYTVGQVVSYPAYILPIYGLVYFVAFWWWRGQTPGKMIIGARVVRTNGARVGVDRVLLRYIFYMMPLYGPIIYLGGTVSVWFVILLPIIATVLMALSRQKRGIHDLIAGTCVINTRIRVEQPEEVEVAEAEQSEKDDSGISEQR